jgi:hypothetical protein
MTTMWLGLYVGLLAATPEGPAAAAAVDAAEAARTIAVGVVFHDRNGNGVRDAGEEGLAGVRVSNQHDVVETDADGRWRLPVEIEDDTTFFVVKPRGWMTPVDEERQLPRFYYTHKPNGSPPLRYGGVEPTGPLPESIDFPLRPNREPDTFRAIFFGDTQARNQRELEYMAHDVIVELIGTDAAFGVTLGDIVFDDLSLFDLHNRTVALIGIPWYNVLGNHDMDFDAVDDRHSDETFERHYGPNYYAFEHGPTHFIVLDNVHWRSEGSKRTGSYTSLFDEDQLRFVRNYLAGVPEDRLVLLMMHIPITRTEDREAMFRLIGDRPYVMSIAAHTHTQEHVFLDERHGWRASKPHHHVINVTVCGSWWRGLPDDRGIPHTTMRDGAPNGYSIITFDGNEAIIDFKAARRPATYQMNIYAPYSVTTSEAAEVEVLVNVFGGSERSTVEMRLGTDGQWQPLDKVLRKDPAYEALFEVEKDLKSPWQPMREGINSPHIWQGWLPADPRPGMSVIHVRTTDMYGRTFEAARAIHIR